MTAIADAFRSVTAKAQWAIDNGCRSRAIDADDLVEVLLAIADELNPPQATLLRAPGRIVGTDRPTTDLPPCYHASPKTPEKREW